jgi:protein-disulfide isomerase-like protein with CxxC motif
MKRKKGVDNEEQGNKTIEEEEEEERQQTMRAMKNKRYVEGKRLENEKQKERILELELRVEELEEENRALTEAVNVLEQSRALQEQVVAEQENRLKELELENKEETAGEEVRRTGRSDAGTRSCGQLRAGEIWDVGVT